MEAVMFKQVALSLTSVTFLVLGLLSAEAKTSELHDAVKADDLQRVQALLEAGAQDLNKVDVFLGTPLHFAASRGSLEITRLLIEAGADVNAEGAAVQRKGHPLHAAALVNRVAVGALLIERGAEVDALNSVGETALIVASLSGHPEMVELLISAGADVLAEDPHFHYPALHAAASRGQLNVVKLLLAKGGDVNRQSGNGGTALLAAAINDRLEVLEFLLDNGADANVGDNGGNTPIAVSHSREVQELLRKHGAKE
jgi:ankyrin repeat protein